MCTYTNQPRANIAKVLALEFDSIMQRYGHTVEILTNQ
jgi:hypothetical protein